MVLFDNTYLSIGIFMLNPQLLRHHSSHVAQQLKKRGFVFDHLAFDELEQRRKKLQVETQELQNARNEHSKNIGIAKAKQEDITEITQKVKKIGDELSKKKTRLDDVQASLHAIMMGSNLQK